jgi:hypothetical protein
MPAAIPTVKVPPVSVWVGMNTELTEEKYPTVVRVTLPSFGIDRFSETTFPSLSRPVMTAVVASQSVLELRTKVT